MKIHKKSLLAGAILLSLSLPASAVTVDLFDVAQARLTDNAAEANLSFIDGSAVHSSVNGPVTSVLGGNRDMGVNLLTDPLVNGAYVQVAGGYFSFSSGSGADSQAIVQWDGATNTDLTIDPTGLAGANLKADGHDHFGVQTIASDLGFLFTITVWDMLGDWTAVTLASHSVPLTMPDGVASQIGFDTFENCGPLEPLAGVVGVSCGVDGVDMSNVGAIQLVVNPFGGYAALDLTLNSITTVPEPSLLGLLGIGLAGLGAVSSRRNTLKA